MSNAFDPLRADLADAISFFTKLIPKDDSPENRLWCEHVSTLISVEEQFNRYRTSANVLRAMLDPKVSLDDFNRAVSEVVDAPETTPATEPAQPTDAARMTVRGNRSKVKRAEP